MHTAISRIDRDILPLFTRVCNLFSTINVAVISQIDLPTTIDKTIDKLHLWHFKHGGKDKIPSSIMWRNNSYTR